MSNYGQIPPSSLDKRVVALEETVIELKRQIEELKGISTGTVTVPTSTATEKTVFTPTEPPVVKKRGRGRPPKNP